MKFDSNLNYFDNIKARRDYYHEHIEQKIYYEQLDMHERNQLMLLNEFLKRLEVQYLPIMNAKGQALQARVADPADWMQEFSLELVLTYYLREDDPEFDEDDDNILMEIHERNFDYDTPNRDWGFGLTDIYYCEDEATFEGEQHGYLYHQLYNHCDLDWRDLLRIGEVYIEITIYKGSGMLPINGVMEMI